MLYTRRFGLLVSTKMFQDSRDAAFLSAAPGFSGAGLMLSWDGMVHRNGKYQASQTIPRPEAPGYNGYESPSTEHLGKAWVGIKRDFDFRVAKSKSSRFHSEVSKSAWDSLVINHCAANQCTLGPRPLMHNVGSDVPFPKSVL